MKLMIYLRNLLVCPNTVGAPFIFTLDRYVSNETSSIFDETEFDVAKDFIFIFYNVIDISSNNQHS